MDRKIIVADARALIGVPFQHQGRDPEEGLDCVGSILNVFLKNGWLPLNEETLLLRDYERIPDGKTLQTYLEIEAYPIPFEEILPADIALMQYNDQPQHVALFSDPPPGRGDSPYIIHATCKRGMREHRWDFVNKRKTIGAYRMRGF